MRWVAFDRPGAGWTAQGPSTAIARDQVQSLGGVVRVRTWLSHAPSPMLNRTRLSHESPTQQKVTI
jgi:hypothetical protein